MEDEMAMFQFIAAPHGKGFVLTVNCEQDHEVNFILHRHEVKDLVDFLTSWTDESAEEYEEWLDSESAITDEDLDTFLNGL